jgi:hypothetical protein
LCGDRQIERGFWLTDRRNVRASRALRNVLLCGVLGSRINRAELIDLTLLRKPDISFAQFDTASVEL